MLSRKPQTAYAHFRELLGRSAGHPATKGVEALNYGTKPYMNATRGGQNFEYTTKDKDKTITSFSAEELAAMVFFYARDITKDFGGLAVRDAVITVPAFATAHERRALIAAAEIAGLKVRKGGVYGRQSLRDCTMLCFTNPTSQASPHDVHHAPRHHFTHTTLTTTRTHINTESGYESGGHSQGTCTDPRTVRSEVPIKAPAAALTGSGGGGPT